MTQNNSDNSGHWYGTVSTRITPERLAEEYWAWKEAYVAECSQHGSAYVRKDDDGTVSEGIAYGMLLAVGNDDRDLFDKLNTFYHDHLNAHGLMNWKMEGCAKPGDNHTNAATDAELDAAMALIQAHARWGGYRDIATTLITNIKTHETCESNGQLILRPGDTWGGCDDPNPETNPSYFAPGYYRAFAHFLPEQKDHWLRLAADSYPILHANQQAMNGLFSDWCSHTGAITRKSLYHYDACRVPWRMAVDYGWSNNQEAKQILTRLNRAGAGSQQNFPHHSNSAFRGGFALTSVVSDQATFDNAVDIWLTGVTADDRYFQTTLRNLYLLVATGNFPSHIPLHAISGNSISPA